MSKLRVVDSDWDNIPADVEEIGVDKNGDITYYKNIKENTYDYKMPQGSWSSSKFTPVCKERAKRPFNTFTKSMLVAGKHIVETVSGSIYVVFSGDDEDFFFSPEKKAMNLLSGYFDDLTCDFVDDRFDVQKVYTTDATNFSTRNPLKLIWERTPPKVLTQKELQLAALQDTINKAQEQIVSLMGVSKEFLGGQQ